MQLLNATQQAYPWIDWPVTKMIVQRCQTQRSLYTVIIVTTDNLSVHVLNYKLVSSFSYCLIIIMITDVYWLL